MSALFAFLHHVAAFVLFSTLVLELVLLGGELTLQSARKIQRADMAFGIAAGAILVIGFLRVYCFEKGAEYYYHSAPFIAKMSLFVIVGLLSIYPTLEFLKWGKSLKHGQVPVLEARKLRTLRTLVQIELTGVVMMLLAAALMARGIGYFG
jgi:putative membrane protein